MMQSFEGMELWTGLTAAKWIKWPATSVWMRVGDRTVRIETVCKYKYEILPVQKTA